MLFTYLIITMLKKTPLKAKKFYTLKKSPLKVKKNYSLKKTQLKKPEDYELKKQSDKAKEKWEEARQKCLERDHNKCIVCGKLATQVHHIHLRSKRKDLLYFLPNLCSLCDKHHFHQGSDRYELQCQVIAIALHMSVEDLLKYAEGEKDGRTGI